MDFRWLHLTDFHLGMTQQGHLWPNVREAFLTDLAAIHDITGPWDAVLFTGDLVQSGSRDEFNRLDDMLGGWWREFRTLGSDPVLLAVPGNHDLMRPSPKNSAVRLLTKWNTHPEIHEEFWSDPACECREVVQESFGNYLAWWERSPLRSPIPTQSGLLPGDFSATIGPAGKTIGVVGLNTAFLQLCGGDFERSLAWDPRQLHAACGGDGAAWAKGHEFCFLLTHHPPSWLDEFSREGAAEIAPAGRFIAHLCGHMHEQIVRGESEGGGPVRRLWQGASLFGLEKYGEPPKEHRRHGFTVGNISAKTDRTELRLWPRRAMYHAANGWSLIPDHESCTLEADGGTRPEIVSLTVGGKVLTGAPQAIESIRSERGKDVSCCDSSGRWGWPSEELTFRDYCRELCKEHGFVRFVEMPYQRETPDIELNRLYVEPQFSTQEVHADTPTSSKLLPAVEALADRRCVVLLGDPGSGKSILVSSITWQLARSRPVIGTCWSERFGGLLPIPMVLRELNLKADLTLEGLLRAFIEHRIGGLLGSTESLVGVLRTGRGIVLLDGLDEIGTLSVRRKLREAVHLGMSTYPQSLWVMTSRIVGYEQVPFHLQEEVQTKNADIDSKLVRTGKSKKRVSTPVADVLYLAPFTDEQIREFSHNWYSQHEKNPDVVKASSRDFVNAINENEGTKRLARIPNLLTLMALIHHKNARLPYGRTDLYNRIAGAYLESIDVRRKLSQLPYSLEQKRHWLAEIAYQMQLGRAKGSRTGQASILASRRHVESWLRRAMKDVPAQDAKQEAQVVLNYFAERSGLLFPRGDGKFAFIHLSLQEYFAACFLKPQLTALRFGSKHQQGALTGIQLRKWAADFKWREAFVFLFELLADRSQKDSEALIRFLFVDQPSKRFRVGQIADVELIAEIATNPFVRISAVMRRDLRQLCWRRTFRGRAFGARQLGYEPTAARVLLREQGWDLARAWQSASLTKAELRSKIKFLSLDGCSGLADLRPLSNLQNLDTLSLFGCVGVQDISPLGDLKQLRGLLLEQCTNVSDIGPIANLSKLENLVLGGPADLTPLSNLRRLVTLHLHFMEPVDLTPVAMLQKLMRVCVLSRRPDDISISRDLAGDPSKILSPGVRGALKGVRPGPIRPRITG
jgi:hypothetical protein